jgi:hypothetical protein
MDNKYKNFALIIVIFAGIILICNLLITMPMMSDQAKSGIMSLFFMILFIPMPIVIIICGISLLMIPSRTTQSNTETQQ